MIPVREAVEYLIDNRIIVLALVVANYGLAFVCAIREITISRTSQGSIAWLLSLLLLPFPTTFVYLAFGWKLADDMSARKAAVGRSQRIKRAHDLSLRDDDAIAAWPVLAAVSQLPFQSGNEVELLIDGEATFQSIFEGIARARHTVFAQFFIIRDDRLGQELATRLIERAQAGVEVYLLYDDVGSLFLPHRYLARLRKGGVKVSSFNKRHKLLRFYGPMRINYRNHRKIVVVDGAEAWVGGQNIGIEYLGEDRRFGRWRDTQVHVTGPAATSCGLVFREDWHWATNETISAPPPGAAEASGEQSVLVMPSGPADNLEECAIAFSEVIARARKRVWIVSPYFVPDVDMQTALFAAALRGVDVRILIPRKPDHLLVWLASNAHASKMIDHGISVYRYSAGFLHQKVILMDDDLAGVGTVNFDNRSFSINFEITLWFTHPKMIADVDAMLSTDFADSRKFTVEVRENIPYPLRFAGYAARLLSPLL
jgi:cardiolipin synthase